MIIKKNEKTCTLIDVTIPADGKKEAENKLKHNSLSIKIQ
jgi:hypothetical protein